MEILNLRKIEKIIAILWDGENDTLDYLNTEFLSISIIFNSDMEKNDGVYTVAKFESKTNGDLLLTQHQNYDITEQHLKTFEIYDYICLTNEYPYVFKKTKEELRLDYEQLDIDLLDDIELMLKNALDNEDYILAAKLRDRL